MPTSELPSLAISICYACVAVLGALIVVWITNKLP